MKMKKIASVLSAAALISAMAVPVSAADWNQVHYADNDPSIVTIVETNANGFTFKHNADGDIAKARITLNQILKNPADYAKIAKMEWTVTYNGVKPDTVAESGLCGGTYATNTNSVGYKILDETDEEGNNIWTKDTYTVTDSVEFAEPPVEDGEMVFMDWSYADLGNQGVTVTISDFKIYDADGNEIEQLGLDEFSASTEATTEGSPEGAEEKPPVTDPAPEDTPSDTTVETNVQTGNGLQAVAAIALLVSGLGLALRKNK